MGLLVIDLAATAIEGVLLYYMMDSDWEENIFHPLRFGITLLFSVSIIFGMSYLGLSPEQKLFAVLLLFSATGIIVHRISFYRAVLSACLLHLSLGLGELLVQLFLMTVSGQPVTDVIKKVYVFAAVVFISKGLAAFLVIRLKKSFGDLTLSFDGKAAGMVLFPLLLTLLLETKLKGLILGYTEDFMIWNEQIFSAVLLVFSLCLVMVLRYAVMINDMKLAENRNEYQMEEIYRYYQKRLEHEQQAKKIYHDLQNHLRVLESMEEGEEKAKYAGQLRETLHRLPHNTYTGNEMIDLILHDKKEEHQDITLCTVCTGNVERIKAIKDFDLVTIFGNALDNAAEALRKQKCEEKVVNIRMDVFYHFILLEFANNCGNKKINYAETSKRNKELHGFGLSNIAETVEKYDGQMDIRNEGGKFVLRILFSV